MLTCHVLACHLVSLLASKLSNLHTRLLGLVMLSKIQLQSRRLGTVRELLIGLKVLWLHNTAKTCGLCAMLVVIKGLRLLLGGHKGFGVEVALLAKGLLEE